MFHWKCIAVIKTFQLATIHVTVPDEVSSFLLLKQPTQKTHPEVVEKVVVSLSEVCWSASKKTKRLSSLELVILDNGFDLSCLMQTIEACSGSVMIHGYFSCSRFSSTMCPEKFGRLTL